MDINVKITYDHKWKYYKFVVRDESDKELPFVAGRVFEKEYEAEIAAGIMKSMFDKIENCADFDKNLFDFNIRAVLRLIDSPGKW